MRQYSAGSTVDLRHEIRDVDDELVDATAVLTITQPDGTNVAPAVTISGVGLRDAAYLATQYGPYTFVWTVTGAVNTVKRGQFYVADDGPELPPLAGLDQLIRKLGYTPEDEEAERASEDLAAASTLIRDVAETTWTNATTGALLTVPDRVRKICVEAAFRAFGNAEALSQRSIGDSSKSYDRAKREGGEAVYLTDAEEKAIKKAVGASSMVAVTLVSPYNGSYLDDETGDLVWA
jgi:hypothetical protein